jgi:hypothetical protein
MKRDVLCVIGCVFLSVVTYAGVLSIQLKYSRWGTYTLDPRANQTVPVGPEHQEVVGSLRRMLILTHVLILPGVSILVGCFAGFFSTRPATVAFLGILPFRLLYLYHDGLFPLSIASAIADIGMAILVALLVRRLFKRHLLTASP